MSVELLKERISKFTFALSKFSLSRLLNFSRAVLLSFIVHLSSNLSQKKLIEQEEWDYLIVLDGCSYDYFKRVNSIQGKLSCVISAATGTGFWAMRTWTRNYDAVYISANPHINSSGYAPVAHAGRIKLFNPSNFRKVIDVWDEGWNEDCVFPETVNSYTISNLYPHMIIHYLQPHAPFIGDVKLPVASPGKVRKWLAENNLGAEYYREAYISNLKGVLTAVKSLLPYLDGKVVITADHGYWDGSNGNFCHEPYGSYLHKVPWLEVFNHFPNKARRHESKLEKEKTKHTFTSKEEEEIKRRLRSLGYF